MGQTSQILGAAMAHFLDVTLESQKGEFLESSESLLEFFPISLSRSTFDMSRQVAPWLSLVFGSALARMGHCKFLSIERFYQSIPFVYGIFSSITLLKGVSKRANVAPLLRPRTQFQSIPISEPDVYGPYS